jgi:uroporphyrinogen decarboxylase
MTDISYWPDTIDRWHREGLPWGMDPVDYFELDLVARYSFDGSLRLPTRTLEETEEWVVSTDTNGATRKRWKRHYATPGHVEPSIRARADWERVKGNLVPDPDRLVRDVNGVRFDGQLQLFRIRERMGAYRVISPIEPAWFALQMLGFEEALMMFADDPEWAEDIFSTYTDFALAMCQQAVDHGLVFDGMWLFSDLCFRNGMLFSPEFYRERLSDTHRRYAAFCREHDWDFILHCDGDVRQFIPLLIEVGFGCIQPLEARAGNDVCELKRCYGDRFAFFGSISTDVMGRSLSEIEEEVVSKVTVAKEGGGYLYHCDHSIPPTVSFENYCYVVELLRKHGAY